MESMYLEIWKFQFGKKKKLFHHEESQAVEDAAQRSCVVSTLVGF